MRGGEIDIRKSVYRLCAEHPALADALAEAGFSEITRPGMLSTAGRFMTIPNGAKLRGIDPEHILAVLRRHGYRITEGEWT
jgi:hypothetical protein